MSTPKNTGVKRGRKPKEVLPASALGSQIRKARLDQELTTTALGEKIGVSNVTLTYIETGQTNPSRRTLMLLARELNNDFGLPEMRPYAQGSKGVAAVRMVGRVSAGKLIEPLEEVEEVLFVESDLRNIKNPRALRVVGHSMHDAGILDNDIVLVGDCSNPRNKIVVAYVEENHTLAATLKIWRERGDMVTLEPANPDYANSQITKPKGKVQCYGAVYKVVRNVR